jgi:hypothetical protein
MVGAAVGLLVVSLLQAFLGDEWPRGVFSVGFAIGYVFLAWGFFAALRARSAKSVLTTHDPPQDQGDDDQHGRHEDPRDPAVLPEALSSGVDAGPTRPEHEDNGRER